MATAAISLAPVPSSPISEIAPLVQKLRTTFESGKTKPLSWRREQLEALLRLASENGDELVSALQADLGKPELEARVADISQITIEAKLALKNLKKWTRPQRAGSIPLFGRSFLVHDPLGVVLIIAPWNYPVALLIAPLIGAIAAGNTVVLKPSEVTAHTSSLLTRLINKYMDSDAIAIVEGGVPETTALLEQRFDHILYTGNGTVAKVVMEAAAKHLTPVTLELGGKSPCIVDRTANIPVTARRIAWGKFLNAGQTCIAPDYILADQAIEQELIEELEKSIEQFYNGETEKNPDYTRIVNERHHKRISHLIEGEDVAFGGSLNQEQCHIEPTVLRNVSPDAPIMQTEIFGPVLPVLSVGHVDEAIDFINQREKPLALYLFSSDSDAENQVLQSTSSGGACINGTVMHIANPKLPFGGVGPSGMGAYHGRYSFETFSHRKAVLRRSFRLDFKLMYPPYTEGRTRMLKKFL
ncbi:MAG: aldehyde dehydrogenase family protein [Deltaproteobacteria bacterium]|nr:aldehyde dehydrogenase family protein [Deltaproteobacteria bacterium]